MKFILKFLFFIVFTTVYSQETPNFKAVDSLYREDQFYVGITYNSIQNKNNGIVQGKFTPSFMLGFLRDMPVNKSRTFAFAAGLGYSINNYNQNILTTENNGVYSYNLINSSYSINKQILHYLEIPLEIRWRNSTPESHKFWRVYAGFKLGYLVYDRAKFEDDTQLIRVTNNLDFNKFQYGTYLAMGNNTINAYVYYGLNPMYKSGLLDNNSLNIKTINFGLMFYIL